MRVIDFKDENGVLYYENPYIRVPLPVHRCGNVGMLFLLTQWLQTEQDCRLALQLIGQETGLGHLTNYELILLLDRVHLAIADLFNVIRIQDPQASRDALFHSMYGEFVRADAKVQSQEKTEVCHEVDSVWDVLPDLVDRILKMMEDASEITPCAPREWRSTRDFTGEI